MTCWSHLPEEILGVVFEYLLLEYDGKKSVSKNIYYRTTKDIRQCQQTCKSWAKTAQINLYEHVVLYNSQSAELFVLAVSKYNLGYLVKAVFFYSRRIFLNRQTLQSLLQKIGNLCPDLKRLEVAPYLYEKLWECIQVERLKGSFSNLRIISAPSFSMREVPKYYEAAYSLRETLSELTIYVGKLAPIENLEFFKNIDTLYFQLESSTDIYTLDQQIKRCPTVEFIVIKYIQPFRDNNEEYLLMHDTKICSSVPIFSQVKQLFVENIKFESRLYGYLMDKFPNLDELKLDLLDSYNDSRSQQSDKISNNTAFRFLSYLMKMSSANVPYFPVENAEDLLKNFQDINGMNRHLSIIYKRQSPSSPYLAISSTKQKIDILVTYKNYEQINFPRIGMIEKSGTMLQSLTLNMGMEFNLEDPKMDVIYSGADFFHILLQCPNLKNIQIWRTPLYCSGIHLQQKQGLSLCSVIFELCFIDDSFFPSLSYHVNYIKKLRIMDTVFFGGRNFSTNKSIDMPETEFNRIDYFYQYIEHEHSIFLKLKKTGDDNVGWFVSKKNGFEICTEEDYETSLHDIDSSMSVFICCADVSTIKFGCTVLEATFET